MKAILVNYNYTPEWIKDYDFDYEIYDRSDDGYLRKLPNVINTENIGNADYDKLGYLIDNYDNLPDIFLWGKTNLFNYVYKNDFDKLKDNNILTPLLKPDHKAVDDILGPVAFYIDGMYYEKATMLTTLNTSIFSKYGEFAWYMELPFQEYLPFPPGGNFILTKECVHKYPKEFYEKMRKLLDYCQLPIEAHFCERTYFTLWKQ